MFHHSRPSENFEKYPLLKTALEQIESWRASGPDATALPDDLPPEVVPRERRRSSLVVLLGDPAESAAPAALWVANPNQRFEHRGPWGWASGRVRPPRLAPRCTTHLAAPATFGANVFLFLPPWPREMVVGFAPDEKIPADAFYWTILDRNK